MASFGFTVNPAEIEERGGNFKAIPAGKHLLQAMTGEIEPNKDGTGQNVWFSFEVVSGEHQGSSFRHYIHNIIHENPDKQNMGQRELGEFARAINVIAEDTEIMLFKPFMGEVHFFPVGHVEKNKNTGYEFTYKYDTNKIARYKAADGAAPVAQSRPATPQAQPARPAYVAPAAAASKPVPSWHKPRAA